MNNKNNSRKRTFGDFNDIWINPPSLSNNSNHHSSPKKFKSNHSTWTSPKRSGNPSPKKAETVSVWATPETSHQKSFKNQRHSLGGISGGKNLAANRMQNLRKSLPAVIDSDILKSGQCSKYVKKPQFSGGLQNSNSSVVSGLNRKSPIRTPETQTSSRTPLSTRACTNTSFKKSPTSNLVKTFANERLKKLREDLEHSTNAVPQEYESFSTPTKNTTRTEKSESLATPSSSSSSCSSPQLTPFKSRTEQVSPNRNELCEEMEWESMPEETIISNIEAVRKTKNQEVLNTSPPISFPIKQESNDDIFNIQEVDESEPVKVEVRKLIIVIDTNVFLSNLRVIKDLINFEFSPKVSLVVVIPWMVLQELDFFKNENDQLKRNSAIAIRYINQQLSDKNPKMKGQTAVDASDNKIICSSPDDRILDCCLQYKVDKNIVVILTNDVNLKNKALVNNLDAYSSEEVLIKLQTQFPTAPSKPPPKPVLTPEEENALKKLKHFHNCLCKLLRNILQIEMQNAYGDMWVQMSEFKPSWTAPMLLKCFLKYWKSVFGMVFPKHVLPCFEKLLRIFDNCKHDEKDLNKLIRAALDICLHLQNVSEEYYHRIMPALKELKAQL